MQLTRSITRRRRDNTAAAAADVAADEDEDVAEVDDIRAARHNLITHVHDFLSYVAHRDKVSA